MKTVSIALEDTTWEAVQKIAHAQEVAPDLLVLKAVADLAAHVIPKPPSPAERSQSLAPIWTAIDACHAEVGEQPTRARTYDDRRFHRH